VTEAPRQAEGRKDDAGKLRFDLIPPEAPLALAEVLTPGAVRYGERNWEKGFNWSRAEGALQRHLNAWRAGEDKDPDSGLSHLKHILTNAAFLVAFEARGIGTDDRPRYRDLDAQHPLKGCYNCAHERGGRATTCRKCGKPACLWELKA